MLLQAYLTKGGLTEADITLKDMSAADAAAAFTSGQVDAAVSYEPWLTRAAKDGGGEVIFSTKDTNLIADVITTRQTMIETRKADLQAYVKAIEMNKSLGFNASDPNNAMKNFELNVKEGNRMKILSNEESCHYSQFPSRM